MATVTPLILQLMSPSPFLFFFFLRVEISQNWTNLHTHHARVIIFRKPPLISAFTCTKDPTTEQTIKLIFVDPLLELRIFYLTPSLKLKKLDKYKFLSWLLQPTKLFLKIR